MNFIEIREHDYSDIALLNLDHVPLIIPSVNAIFIDSITGTGNGIIHVNDESMERILREIGKEKPDGTAT